MMRAAVEESRTSGSRLEDLYRLHAGEGIRLAYLITGDRVLAEDIVQDAFVKLAARLRHLRDPNGLAPYLRQIIVNLTNAYFRRRKVERRYLKREATQPQPAQGPDVAERDAVWALLRALPTRQRIAIVLRFYEDLSVAQTAEVMRCRPGTVKSLVSRGTDRLRQVMAGE